MKKENSEILSRLGKDPGFKVPEHYFDDFAKQMADKLPETQITEVDTHVSLWDRVKTYVYMAAMFAGIWCMLNVFNLFNGNDAKQPVQMAEDRQEQAAPQTLTADTGKFNYEDSVKGSVTVSDNAQ